jgi:hypothetical protein
MLELQRLDSIHDSLKLNLSRVKLIAAYNCVLFHNYPNGIPEQIQEGIAEEFGKSLSSSFDYLLKKKGTIELHGFSYIAAMFHFHGNPIEGKENFEQVILQQEWITYFAYIEAFFQDAARFLYSIDKGLLANDDKKISWNSVLIAADYDQIIESMIEDCLIKSGYQNLADLIEKWNRPPFKLRINIDKETLAALKFFIVGRNIIIHNDAKKTPEFIQLAEQVIGEKASENDPQDQVGSKLTVDKELVTALYGILLTIADEVYDAIKLKYSSPETQKV